MRNLHLVFNKLCYSRLGMPDFATSLIAYNQQITRCTFDHRRDFTPPVPGSVSFTLRVEYPGLLLGSSSYHGVGKMALEACMGSTVRRQRQAQDFSGGVSLDYVTGQPYIPGSMVKGMLRGYFQRHPLAVAEVLGCSPEEIPRMEQAFFEEGDTFFDAVVFDSDHRGRLLGREFVTMQDRHTGAFRGITMLKVRPGVRFQFRFLLTDGLLTPERKLWLYRQLLLIGGIGSRTRMGYGVLAETDESIRPKQSTPPLDETRRRCPHCGASIYRRNRQGVRNTHCYRCHLPLEEEIDHVTV